MKRLGIVFREFDDYHAISILDERGCVVTPIPLTVFRHTEKPEDDSYRRTYGVWAVHDHTGRHYGYVRDVPEYWRERQLAVELVQAVESHRENSLYMATFESEAARAGVYIAFIPREDDPNAALFHADGTSPYTLHPLWSAEAPALKAWLPAGFTFHKTRVVWHPAPKFEPIED